MIGSHTKSPLADDNRRPPDNNSRRMSPKEYRRPVVDLADEDHLPANVYPANVHPRPVEHQTSPTPKSAWGRKEEKVLEIQLEKKR